MELSCRRARTLATRKWHLQLIIIFTIGVINNPLHPAQAQTLGFTSTQAQRGQTTYERICGRCHGLLLQGGEFGPPLLGETFIQHWAGRPLSGLFSFIRSTMPPGHAQALPNATCIDLIAYVFENYGVRPSATRLSTELPALETLLIPGKSVLEPYARDGGLGLAPGVAIPKWPHRPSPLEKFTPVSDTLLSQPPDGSWLIWRRTLDDAGFSGLRQITKSNVRRLRLAWSLALPPGPNETTPLVHNGVIFVHSFGDHVQALDAATGDELWHYYWELPVKSAPTVHRNMALYDDKLYFTTSNGHVVALKAQTGDLVWQRALIGSSEPAFTTGGPLVVRGVVMQGGSTIQGGGFVIGLDAATGEPLWRFNTIARQGEPNGASWNGVPMQKRTGGTVWTAGSFDTDTGLAFFGPAPTYNTEPLRKPLQRPGITNDALYTNATIALDPRTGKLVWYYQHIPNDQWDLDWAFERQIVHLPINGTTRKLVITAGKEAIYDALDVETGKFRFSLDLGLQNLIASVDRQTGTKAIRSELIPGDGKTVTVCPNEAAGKSWLPGSFDEAHQVLYVSLVDVCMDLVPTRKGRGFLSSNVSPTLRPPDHSDGKYGRLQALNLANRQTLWTLRQRAPITTGTLATAGDLVFIGDLDRWFMAFSADTGGSLWKIRLGDVPNAAPITYLAEGRQYVAVVTGRGYGHTEAFFSLVPEIRPALTQSSAIWVFELSE